MALNISTILTGIGKFSSESQEEIKQFIANCDLYNDLAGNDMKPIVLKVIRTRLVTVTKLGRIDTLTWTQIKAKINNAFKPEISFDAAQEKLLAIKQYSHETVEMYGDRLKKLLDAMNMASTSDNADVQEAQYTANEKLAVRKFKQNLHDPNLRMISLAVNHNNLYDAITFVDEKREELNTTNVETDDPEIDQISHKEDDESDSISDGTPESFESRSMNISNNRETDSDSDSDSEDSDDSSDSYDSEDSDDNSNGTNIFYKNDTATDENISHD